MKLYQSLLILIQHISTFKFEDWLDSDLQMNLENGIQLLKPLVDKKLKGIKRALTDASPDVISYAFYTRGMPEHFARTSIGYSSDGSLRYSPRQMRFNFWDLLQDVLDNADEDLTKEQREHLRILLKRHASSKF